MLRAEDLEEMADLISEKYREIEFPEPREWMRQTEQVLDSYKNEVELLRKSVRDMQAAMTRISRDHRNLMTPVRENNKILNEIKQTEEKVKGRA